VLRLPSGITVGPSADDVIAACRQADAREAAEQAERERVAREVREQALQVLRERRTTTRSWGEIVPDWPVTWGEAGRAALDEVRALPEAQAWLAELQEQNARAKAEAEAAREAERAKAEAERERALAQLREWALQHGSERVRLLIEEQHRSWRVIAEEEFLRAHVPQGWVALDDLGSFAVRERTKPQVADILALREARALAGAEPAFRDPEMRWLVVYRPATEDEIEDGLADDDGEIVDRKFPAIVAEIVAPTGARLEIYRAV
jgi:hypothetical protein